MDRDARVRQHPILGGIAPSKRVSIEVDGRKIWAREGEPIAAALTANGIRHFRFSPKYHQPRGLFCAIGRCTDCVMTVDEKPNVRTCITPVRAGMRIKTQQGIGKWREK